MASVFKREGRKKWLIGYTDGFGRRRTVTGAASKTVTEQIAGKLEGDAELQRRGIIDPRQTKYAEAERQLLVIKDADGKITGGHLHDLRETLIAKGNTVKHADLVVRRAARILGLAKAEHISDIAPSKVQAALKVLRDQDLSLQSCNHYLRAIKQFSRWLWRDGRRREDSLAHLTGYNVKLDRRRQRRPLSSEEYTRLIKTTEAAGPACSMTGPDRAMLYRLAVGTGFRANELRSLTPESFDLQADPPTVTVEAGYSKHRRADTQLLRQDLADLLGDWLTRRAAGERVFQMPDKTARMLRSDLKAAQIPIEDRSGRVVDFHALRHTAGSLLKDAGVYPKLIQAFMRHSTITLTMDRYTHIEMRDRQTVLNALPGVDLGTAAKRTRQLKATGTYDERAAHAQVRQHAIHRTTCNNERPTKQSRTTRRKPCK